MNLAELFQTIEPKPVAVYGSLDREITGIAYDSRRVVAGNLFVAMPGVKTDGHRFVEAAIDHGATAVVFEGAGGLSARATRIQVENARRTLALAAAQFYHHPSRQLKVVGVTGTNGKTTTAFMVKAMMEAAGIKAGLLGTVRYEIGDREIPAVRTTPESVEVQDMLQQMRDKGCGGVAMEVSSHALDQHRVTGMDFDVAVFTNLTRDHLDYHITMENYFNAKTKLFQQLGTIQKPGRAVVNVDCKYGRRLVTLLGGENAVLTYGVSGAAAIRAEDVRVSAEGTYFVAHTPRGRRPITLPLIGRYNVANALAALGAGTALGLDLATMEQALTTLRQVPGRLERVEAGRPYNIYVDYAHTPDAIDNVLHTVHELTLGRLIVVFGCGGDRDPGKRAPMGAAANKYADFSILTSDNPRTEDPREILRQVEAGFPANARDRYCVIEDRREAIARAVEMARPGDLVLIAGKGHEAYQEFANTQVPFSDRQVVLECLSQRDAAALCRNAVPSATTTTTTTISVSEPRREMATGQRLTLGEVAEMCDATLLNGDPATPVERFHTDTRSLKRGDCFFALSGPHFDGHDFLTVAAERGASAAVVSQHPTRAINSPSVLALLQVQNTLTSLHKLAARYRRLMPLATRVIGITGSCGKTTTKDMIAAVLSQRFNVIKTEGNTNNHIGLPLNLLRLDARHDYGVFELGTNHPGEIETLARILQPDIAVITMVGKAHVGNFPDGEAGVMREKAALLDVLPRHGSGLAVLNADNQWFAELRKRARCTAVSVGIDNPHADIRATDVKINGDVKFRLHIARKCDDVVIRLKTQGRHQIYNALLAAAIGYMQGMDLEEIREGLEQVEYPKMRMQMVERDGIRYLIDCYNANEPAMMAAVQTLREMSGTGRKFAVLGDMLELGNDAQTAHLNVGALVANSGVELLVTVGQSARWIAEGAAEAGLPTHRVVPVLSAVEAADVLRGVVRAGDLVLIKGSRRVGLEKILEEPEKTV